MSFNRQHVVPHVGCGGYVVVVTMVTGVLLLLPPSSGQSILPCPCPNEQVPPPDVPACYDCDLDLFPDANPDCCSDESGALTLADLAASNWLRLCAPTDVYVGDTVSFVGVALTRDPDWPGLCFDSCLGTSSEGRCCDNDSWECVDLINTVDVGLLGGGPPIDFRYKLDCYRDSADDCNLGWHNIAGKLECVPKDEGELGAQCVFGDAGCIRSDATYTLTARTTVKRYRLNVEGGDQLCPGQSTVVSVSNAPRPVRWRFLGNHDGWKLQVLSCNSARVTATDKAKGPVTVLAYDCKYPKISGTRRILLGCASGGCASGSCGSPGEGEARNDGVDVNVGLGKTVDGKSAGALVLHSDVPRTWLAKRAGLQLESLSTTTVIPEYEDGDDPPLKKVKSDEALAVLALNDPNHENAGYSVKFCTPSQVDNWSACPDCNASYGEVPYVTWKFENPDCSPSNPENPSSYNRLRVKKYEGQSLLAEYLYTYDSGTNQYSWVLQETDPNTAAVVRGETATYATDSNGVIQSCTREVVQDGGTASSIEDEYGTFSWGQAITRRTVNLSQGSPLVTEYDYYDANDAYQYYLKSVQYPDGSWVAYTYDSLGSPLRKSFFVARLRCERAFRRRRGLSSEQRHESVPETVGPPQDA